MSRSTVPADKHSEVLFSLLESAVKSCGADLEAVEIGRAHV
jgi:hypothetical protein